MGPVKNVLIRLPYPVWERIVEKSKAAGLSVNAYAVKRLSK